MGLPDVFCGTFTYENNDDRIANFWAKAAGGDEKEKAKIEKIGSSKFTVHIGKHEDKVVTVVKVASKGGDEMTIVESIRIGEETHVSNQMFTGTCFVSITQGKNGPIFKKTMTNEVCGEMEVVVEPTECGLIEKSHSKKTGETVELKWERKVNFNGSFKYADSKNAQQFVEPFIGKADLRDYKVCQKMVGDTVHSVESVGDIVHTWKVKFDEEFDHEGMCTILLTKINDRTFKSIIKYPKTGKIHEWTTKICGNCMCMTAKDLSSGETGFIKMERTYDFSGKYRVLSHSGCKEVAEAAYGNSDFVDDMLKVVSSMKDNGHCLEINFPFQNKDISMCLRFGEESEENDPISGLVWKMMMTRHKNTIMIAAKANVEVCSKIIVTDNFMIKESRILGTDISEKIIYARFC